MEKCMLIFSMHFFVQYQFPFQGIMVFLSDFFFFFHLGVTSLSKYIWTFNKLCLNLNWIFSYLVIYLLSCTGCITFAVVIISSFVCCTTQRVWVLAILYLCSSYPSQCGCPFIFSCRKIFSASLLVFLINSCSTNSCNFGVSVRGGKVRVFLFCHLGHPLPYSFYA